MPLRVRTPPAQATELLRRGLESLFSTRPSDDSIRSTMDAAAVSNLEFAAPHPVYFVGFENLLAGTIISTAKVTGWRYLLLNGESVRFFAELGTNDPEDAGWFSHVDSGPIVKGTVDALEFAEGLEAELGREYEIRLLSIPSVSLLAIWLHDMDDLFVPLAPAPAELKTTHAYTEEQLLTALSYLVLKRADLADPLP